MLKYIGIITLSLIIGFRTCPALEAAGLSTGFSEVTLENLEAGRSYSAKETAGLPLIVVNNGNAPVDLKMEVILPQTPELKEGFEPIPSLSWIRLEETDFREIKPGGSAVTDVIISVPDDKKYRGKKYQVFIWSHTVGGAIGIGLKSKLLLQIAGEEDE